MSEKKNRKKQKNGANVPSAADSKDRVDLLNKNQIDETPKEPPYVGDPMQPPVRL